MRIPHIYSKPYQASDKSNDNSTWTGDKNKQIGIFNLNAYKDANPII